MRYEYEENEVKVLSHQMEQFCGEMKKLTVCFEAMKEESEKTKRELSCTRQALRGIQNEVKVLNRQHNIYEKKVNKLIRAHDAAVNDFEILEESAVATEEEITSCPQHCSVYSRKYQLLLMAQPITIDALSKEVSFQTKLGKKVYSPAIRSCTIQSKFLLQKFVDY